jgi:molecular chaperone GrpE (heat shock protein)
MPEPSPPGVAADAAVGPAQDLTPDDRTAVLADFQRWLAEAIVQPPPANGAPPGPPIDLHTLLGQMAALRQEVNLQTRAVRAQQEQNGETLRDLNRTLDALEQERDAAEQGRQQSLEEQLRPLLKTLVDLDDSLSLAGREVQRLQDAVWPALEQVVAAAETEAVPPPPPAPTPPPPRSLWARWFNQPAPGPTPPAEGERPEIRQERARLAREGGERVRGLLASLVTGYTMSLQRIERALRQHGLEPIVAVGQPFDPERMEAVEVVRDSGRPSGEVVEEVRRGYLYNDRVFRYAQVRVAKD